MPAVHATVTEVLTESATADVEAVGLAIAIGLVVFGTVLRTHRSDRAGGALFSALGYACALFVLAVAVHNNGALTGADGPVTDWFIDHRNPALTHLAIAVTTAGGPAETVALGVLIAALMVWRTKRYGPALVMLATVATAGILSAVLKLVVGRERPPQSMQLVLETDHSFPSGHVTGTATLLMMVALVVTARRSNTARLLLVCIAIAATVVVASSRLYLGVHWLTDVSGGALVAALAVTLGSYALHRLDRASVDDPTPSRLIMNKISL